MIIDEIITSQRQMNGLQADQMKHYIDHPVAKGKRRYRRGRYRCKQCGGYLKVQDLIESMCGIHDVLMGPSTVKTVSGRNSRDG